MIEFYYGVMGSGKSEKLIWHYNIIQSLWGADVLVCNAHFNSDIPPGSVIQTRASGVTIKPVHTITPDFDIKRLDGHDIILIDEAHFLTPDAVRYLSSLSGKAMCFGLLTDFTNKLFDGSQALLYYADKRFCLPEKAMTSFPVQCDYCKRRATHNIRLVNGNRVFEGDQFVLKTDDNVEYKAVCGNCFEMRNV